MIEIRLLALVGLIVTAVVSTCVVVAVSAVVDWARRIGGPAPRRALAATSSRMKA
jgi:hypothetical protein